MFPHRNIEIDPSVPDDFVPWLPMREEVSEEGIGFFRGVWNVGTLDSTDLRRLIQQERSVAEHISGVAGVDEHDFEQLAVDAESCDPGWDGSAPEWIPADWDGLYGLELGVAGAVYSLAATGVVPAASCRSHENGHWTDCPVVLFATDADHLAFVLPAIAAAGCGLRAVNDRGVPLVAVESSSIMEMMNLAHLLFRLVEPEEGAVY